MPRFAHPARTRRAPDGTGWNAPTLGVELEGISLPNFLGRVTYVLYSSDISRIGKRVE